MDGENIALIPGTSIPVSINTVNGGNPLGTDASHPEFFNNNDLDPANDSVLGVHNLEYDGFTATFTAQALNLAPGTHHIKLAIADVSDRFLDSGVFIQGNSFSDNPTDPDDVPEGGGVAILGLAFLGAARRWFKSH